MRNDSYKILIDILKQFHTELDDIESKLEYEKRCIKEADVYAKALPNSDPEDFKIFSPRDDGPVFKDELNRTHEEKIGYENSCRKLEEKRDVLIDKIERIDNVLKNENDNLTVLNFQEEDRQRIARDLHDTSIQNMVHLVHKLELCSLYIDKDPVQAKLELSLVSKCLKETIDEIRNTVFNLRPMTFDDLGFKPALERLIESVNERSKYEVVEDIEDVSCETNLILLAIYRIIQESLINITKHAEAKTIWISCKSKEDICIVDVKDDGKGFSIDEVDQKRHFGLSLIEERVKLLDGKINIVSQPGTGTEIHIEIPLENISSS